MATAEPRRPPRRWLRFGGPLAVLAVGASVVAFVAIRERPPETEPEPDPVAVDADSIHEFTTVDAMAEASDLVVRARVVETGRGELLGTDGADPTRAGVVVREVTLEVDDVWRSAPRAADSTDTGSAHTAARRGDRIRVLEEGWLASGEPLIVDGLGPSAVGDDAIWFLQRIPGVDTDHLVINSQGRYLVHGGRLTGAAGDDALVRQVDELTVQELRARVER